MCLQLRGVAPESHAAVGFLVSVLGDMLAKTAMIVLPGDGIESNRMCRHSKNLLGQPTVCVIIMPGPMSMHGSLCPDEASLVIGFSGLRWTTRALFPLVKLQHLYLRVA